jgi:predicted DNA-binding protein
MAHDTHVNTRHVRLPIVAHTRLALIAYRRRFTIATMVDEMVDEWLEQAEPKMRAWILAETAEHPEPRRGQPAHDALDPLDDPRPPTSRTARIPVRTYHRLRLIADVEGLTYSKTLEALMERHMAKHGLTKSVLADVPDRTPGEDGEVKAAEVLDGEIKGSDAPEAVETKA